VLRVWTAIRAAPALFASGVAVIALGVILITVLLYESNFGLWIGTQAGFQGAGYLVLCRLLENAGDRPSP